MSKKTTSKQKAPRVYVDANIIIELAKQHFDTHDTSRENDLWFFEKMLQASENKEIRLLTSSISIAECTHVDGIADEAVQRFYKGILTSGTMIQLVQDSIFVAEKGRDLRWEHNINLGGADLIHAASAIDAKCSEMITWDGKVRGSKWEAAIPSLLSQGVSVIMPHETSVLAKKYRQGLLKLKFKRDRKKTRNDAIKQTQSQERKPETVAEPSALPGSSSSGAPSETTGETKIEAKETPKPEVGIPAEKPKPANKGGLGEGGS